MHDLVIPLTEKPLAATLREARTAGTAWAAMGLPARLRVIAAARRLIANQATALARTIPRPIADTLVAEILPLLEAARFLERRAPTLLAPRRLSSWPGAGRPLWLFGASAEIRREPLGAILILAPANYPLFLPGAQALQAFAAGNAVCIKPAPGAEPATHAFAAILHTAGLPAHVLHVLDAAAGPEAAAAGFDRIILTGAAETGARVLAAAARTLTPTTMELSGSDAVFILPGADLALVARCLAYGLRLNGGATCIAPRRVFVPRAMAADLETHLAALLPDIPDAAIPPAIAGRLAGLLNQAAADGARVIGGGRLRPTVLADARPEMTLLQQDVFAPWLALVPVADTEAALRDDALCPYALGASIFGPERAAGALARRLRAGSICINDLIVPTADPRLPFGGSARSGFGRTRGDAGLLEMTSIKTISRRQGRFRPHLNPPTPHDATRFDAMARLLHGGWRGWRAALADLAAPTNAPPTP